VKHTHKSISDLILYLLNSATVHRKNEICWSI